MKSFQLGKPFGFPLKVNLSFLLLLGGVWLWAGGMPGVALVVLAFCSVILHELGHAFVARRLGVRIQEIELGFFGGAAKMLDAPRSPRAEIAIAAAGPAVSFVIAGVSYALTAAADGVALSLLTLVATVNLGIGLFNLVPALPMDGGRILRALLSLRMGHLRATEVAVKVARGFALVLGAVGVVGLHFQLVALAAVLWMMGTAEVHAARRQGYASSHVDRAEVEYIPPFASPRPFGSPWRPPHSSGPSRVVVFRF